MIERHSIPKSMRWQVFARDRFSCRYCGRQPPDVVLEVDHVHPVVEGGKNQHHNLVTACEGCNSGKATKLLPEPFERPARKDHREAIEEAAAVIHQYPDVCGGLHQFIRAQMTSLSARGIPERGVRLLMMFTAIDLAATLFRQTEGDVERREFMKICAAAFEDNSQKEEKL